jgi:serine/threonine-protein kinase HipA
VDDRRTFVDAVWVNALLGNGEAHSKNYAMLLTGRSWRLAPLYDINCTLVYDKTAADHGLAMRFDGRTSGRRPDPRPPLRRIVGPGP